jgi:type IV secretory pathway VirB2 component (pilin)
MLTTLSENQKRAVTLWVIFGVVCLVLVWASTLQADVRPEEVERQLSPIYQLLTGTVPKFLCVISLLAGGAFLAFRQVSWGLIAMGAGVFFGLVSVLAKTLTGGM